MILKGDFKSSKDKELKVLKNTRLVENSEMKRVKVEKMLKNLIKVKCKNLINLTETSPKSQNKRISSTKIKIQKVITNTKRIGTVKEMENLKIGEETMKILKAIQGLHQNKKIKIKLKETEKIQN
jgi:hypothetical protein